METMEYTNTVGYLLIYTIIYYSVLTFEHGEPLVFCYLASAAVAIYLATTVKSSKNAQIFDVNTFFDRKVKWLLYSGGLNWKFPVVTRSTSTVYTEPITSRD